MANAILKIESVLSERGLSRHCEDIAVRPAAYCRADLRIPFEAGDSGDTAVDARIVSALNSLPEIECAIAENSAISIRLSDAFLNSVRLSLEAGTPLETDLDDDRAVRPTLVGFLGPNTCKALHLGHLRNIAIGSALTAAFRSAGMRTTPYSLVGDIGRSVCEAMAGLHLLESEVAHEGSTKPDHLIGRCYQEYVRLYSPQADDSNDPCARERTPAADLADKILSNWRAGDHRTRGTWKQMCHQVYLGHRETLRRLGIRVDEVWHESDHVGDAAQIIRCGLETGLLKRLDNGLIVYETGRPEFRRLVLCRSDGFPTEHARVIAIFHQIFVKYPGCLHVDWNGTEWQPAQQAMTDLMRAMRLLPSACTHVSMFHGMVQVDGGDMRSRSTNNVLIDEVLDRLHASDQIASLSKLGAGSLTRDELASLILKVFFLSSARSRSIRFSWPRLLDSAANRGWAVARAWCRANTGAFESRNSQLSPRMRLLLMQSQDLTRHVRRVVRSFDVTKLTQYLTRFSALYLSGSSHESLDGIARGVLVSGLKALGLIYKDITLPPERETAAAVHALSHEEG